MKLLHRPNAYCWSSFDEQRNLDFHSYFVRTEEGSFATDPVPMSEHDRAHLRALGGLDWIIVTNGDHVRDAVTLAAELSVPIVGPAGEKDALGVDCARWLDEGDELLPGVRALAMEGSKTPGELALLVGDHTLITGDLVRAHRGGGLDALPREKLRDPAKAKASVRRLAELGTVEAVLVGDGWPVFREGHERLRELAEALDAA